MPKLRVATSKSLYGEMNPVSYDIIQYNHDMEYHNGVIIIIQSGWYTCTANTQGNPSNSNTSGVGLNILVDNRRRSYGRR